jgi:phage terminase large subunit
MGLTQFPALLDFLLWPSGDERLREICVPIPPEDTVSIPGRTKVVYGGRDGIKSFNFAQALLMLGVDRPLRILCARETQNSIQESVHQVLEEAVKRMELQEFYDVLQYTVRGKNGTEFLFRGIQNLTVEDIKSFQSIDILWVEEAAQVTKRSWQIILPTIRKPGSQIWVTMNPDLATDESYERYILHPPPGAVVLKTSYRDNNWLSDESRAEIELLRRRDPDAFQHVYEGATRSTVEGAIYKAEIMKCEAEGRITTIPYDGSIPVRTFWDLGWSDLVCIWFVQCAGFQYRLIDYYEDSRQSSDFYLQVLQKRGYTYSNVSGLPAITWPWDASTKMNRESTEASVRAKGFSLRILDQASKAGGIDAVRRMFPQFYFDAQKCKEGLNRLRKYQWGPLPSTGKLQREPLHDINSHAADALRVMAASIRTPIKGPAQQREPEHEYSPWA